MSDNLKEALILSIISFITVFLMSTVLSAKAFDTYSVKTLSDDFSRTKIHALNYDYLIQKIKKFLNEFKEK